MRRPGPGTLRLVGLALVVVIGAGLGLAARTSGVKPVRVTSGSMVPTVDVGEWIIVTDTDTAHRGEIVEFRYPVGSIGRAIKRVLAIAGDVVELAGDSISVNGAVTPLAGEPIAFERQTITVPDGYVYLLGDNHAGSYDSRGFGPVPTSEIVGDVRTTIPNPTTLAAWAAGLFGAILVLPSVWRRIRRPRA